MDVIYLDYAATTPLDREVLETMLPCLNGVFGNPSSLHILGQESRQIIEEARAKIARFIGAYHDEVRFTSGSTESNNAAIKGIALANRKNGNHIITTSIEHHSVLDTCSFLEEQDFSVTYLPVDRHGVVAPDDVRRAITEKTVLISVMHANNEIGTIEPVAEIGRIARENGVYFHIDAVQTLGHLPVNVDQLGVDLISASAHKLYGPKGIGMLYIRKGTRISPFIHGGAQEGNCRAGTENVPGIVGFGKAVEIAGREAEREAERITLLRERLAGGLIAAIEKVKLNGHPYQRLPNNVNLTFDDADGEAMLFELRLEGICASGGTACHSLSTKPSHVIMAIGITEGSARNTVRFTLGRGTTEGEIDHLIEVLPPIVRRLRASYIPRL